MKKSFLIYIDSQELVYKLSDEEAGRLFKAMLEYNATGNIPPLDRLLDTLFTSFKAQFDRDMDKWEEIKEKRSAAGKKGGAQKGNQNAKKQAKQASVCFDKQNEQKQAKQAVSVSVSVSDSVSNNKYPYQDIMSSYNDICQTFPKLKILSDKRKAAIRARINSGYTLDDFIKLFQAAESSTFLKGANNKNWSATFDWLITDGNMAKVLDGNYQDKDKPSRQETALKYANGEDF